MRTANPRLGSRWCGYLIGADKLLCAVVLALCFSPVLANAQKRARLTGIVTDSKGAIYVSQETPAVIVLKSSKASFKTKVDAKARFEIGVPAGIYTISIEGVPFGGYYERAPLILDPGQDRRLHVVLSFKFSGVANSVGRSGTYDLWERAPVPGAHPMIIDACNREVPALILYAASDSDAEGEIYDDVAITFSTVSIKAKRAKVKPDSTQILLEGDISLESGMGNPEKFAGPKEVDLKTLIVDECAEPGNRENPKHRTQQY